VLDHIVDCHVSGEYQGGAGETVDGRETGYSTLAAGADAGVFYWADLVGQPVEQWRHPEIETPHFLAKSGSE
jgi:hypothetical protein